MSDSAANNSTRITNRMIYDRQEKIFVLYYALNTEVKVQENKLDNQRIDIGVLKKKTDRLQVVSNRWDVIAGSGGLLGIILGAIGLSNK